MNLQVLGVYDKKAKCYAQPFFQGNLDLGVRALAAAVNSEGTALYHHPEDFALFHLGTYNDETGAFNTPVQPVHVAEAINLKKENYSVQSKVA